MGETRQGLRAALGIAAVFVLLNLFGLDRSPMVWIDEVTLNDPAREWAQHGVLRSSVFAAQPGFEEGYYWQPPGQVLVMRAVYQLFGFGLWQTRIPPLLCAAGALAALHALGLRLTGDRWAAGLATALLGLDPRFLQAARAGRMDPQCLLLLLLATLALLHARDLQNRGTALPGTFFVAVSGLLAGLAGITHPLAVAWTLGLALLLLLLFVRRRFLATAIFGVCAAAPALLWIGHAVAAGQLAAFREQFLDHGIGHLVTGSPPERLLAELVRYGSEYRLTPLLLLTSATALPVFLRLGRYSREAKLTVTVLFLATFLFNAFWMVKNLGFYVLYPAAPLALASGAFLAAILPHSTADLASWRGRAALAWTVLLALNVLAGGLAGRGLSIAFQWRERDYTPVEVAVRESIPPGSVVWGPPEAWYAVEEAGSSLRIQGAPDPAVHDFLVLRRNDHLRFGSRIEHVRSVGQPLPPVLGLRRASADYTLEIWRWREAH